MKGEKRIGHIGFHWLGTRPITRMSLKFEAFTWGSALRLVNIVYSSVYECAYKIRLRIIPSLLNDINTLLSSTIHLDNLIFMVELTPSTFLFPNIVQIFYKKREKKMLINSMYSQNMYTAVENQPHIYVDCMIVFSFTFPFIISYLNHVWPHSNLFRPLILVVIYYP